MYLIRIVAHADGRPCPLAGQYVVSFDPDQHRGRGHLDTTRKIDNAMHFTDEVSAFEFWRQQSTVTPTRPDGKPNRPLTAYTVEMVRA